MTRWTDDCRVTGRLMPGTRGPWEVRTFEVADDLTNMRLMMQGRYCTPGTYTGLFHDQRGVVMSDTTAEIRDLADLFWREPGGRVMVSGLGLGCVVSGLLARAEVEAVDVVEIDPDVIALIGSQLADPRLTIHEGDALTYQWPKGTRWDFAWHDVWDDLNTDNLSSPDAVPCSYAALNRRYGQWARMQGAWGQRLLRSERRRPRW